MSKAFSDKVFSKNKVSIKNITALFVKAQQLAAQNRVDMNGLLQDMKEQERELPKDKKNALRAGHKSLNENSMRDFVYDVAKNLSKKSFNIDYVEAKAIEAGMVSTNKKGLRDSIFASLKTLMRLGLVKRVGYGEYKFIRTAG